MSVFAKNYVTNQYTLFVKGSPEKMKELSKPGTVPANFD
jgi:magnesium-transporting ATPase (P-type)